MLATKTDEVRKVIASDPAERVRYKLQQDKNSYIEAATTTMQHFVERERKRYQKQVKRLSGKFSPPEVLAALQRNTRAHRFWTRSVRDSLEALVNCSRSRRAVLEKLQSVNESVRYDDPAQRLVRYTRAIWSIRLQFMREPWTGSLSFFQAVVPFLNDARALEIVQKVLPLLEKRWISTLAETRVESKQNVRPSPTRPSPSARRRRARESPARSSQKASTYAEPVDEKLPEPTFAKRTPAPSRAISLEGFLYSARGNRGGSQSPRGHSATSPSPSSSPRRSPATHRGLGTSRTTGRQYGGSNSPRSPIIPSRKTPPHPSNWKHYST